MVRALGGEFTARLQRLAINVFLPAGPSMTEAVVLAEDLVAAGDDSPATVAVAALSRDALRRDADDQVRQMLAEHGIAVPVVDDDSRYRVLLTAFAFWGLPAQHVVGAFWRQLPGGDEQSSLDRELVSLLDRRDHEGRPAARQAIEDQMRAAVQLSLTTAAD